MAGIIVGMPAQYSVTVVCDRCHKTVKGYEIGGHGTGGFYRTDNPKGWGRFANPGEKILCDPCMQSDPRYLAEYQRSGGPHVPLDAMID